MNHLKDKLEKDLEFVRISRAKHGSQAPRGGKRILEEERERRTNMENALKNDPT